MAQIGANGMQFPRRQVLALAMHATALAGMSHRAWAQSWPVRPVHIVVGYPAGIVPDIAARLVGGALSSRLHEQFVVENRPGAGTSIAAEEVVPAPADGYTILLVAAANTINTTLYPNLDFNFTRDITPVAAIGGVVFVMAVNSSVPVKTVPDLIAYARPIRAKSILLRAASARSRTYSASYLK
jgi:tripartite-type tricarboxylate transporter receptor subunit TctC